VPSCRRHAWVAFMPVWKAQRMLPWGGKWWFKKSKVHFLLPTILSCPFPISFHGIKATITASAYWMFATCHTLGWGPYTFCLTEPFHNLCRLCSHFTGEETEALEKVNKSPKITQLPSSRAGIWTSLIFSKQETYSGTKGKLRHWKDFMSGVLVGDSHPLLMHTSE
jgi:hypothetical protein